MDYEKKYKEALEKVKGLLKDQEMALHAREKLANVFPELKESEDERIRKEFIAFIKKRDRSGCDYDYDKWLAWLEKQGEQKPVISNDAIREGIAHFGITQYQIDNWLKKYVDVEKQGEQKSAWSEEDEVELGEIIDFFENGTVKLQHDLSLYASWLKSLKDRVQPKQEWSEEDKHSSERLLGWLDTLINYIHHDALVPLDLRRERMQQVEQLKTWLKSLRPQKQLRLH